MKWNEEYRRLAEELALAQKRSLARLPEAALSALGEPVTLNPVASALHKSRSLKAVQDEKRAKGLRVAQAAAARGKRPVTLSGSLAGCVKKAQKTQSFGEALPVSDLPVPVACQIEMAPRGQVELHGGVSFMALKSHHCRYPLWGHGQTPLDQMLFCGERVRRLNAPYCQACHEKTFRAARLIKRAPHPMRDRPASKPHQGEIGA